MQTTNNNIRFSDQMLVTVHDMREKGMTYPAIAEAFNNAGVVKPLSRNEFTAGDMSQMNNTAYPRMMKRKQPHADQVIDMSKMFTSTSKWFGGGDE